MCIHTAESVYETQYIQSGKGEIKEKLLQAVCGSNLPHIQHSDTPVEYLAKLDLLNNYTLLVHAVQVTDDDLKQLAKDDCAIAHCPRSNAFLGVGIAPLGKFWSSNLKVGLGTDSLASNGSLNLWDEMRFAFLLYFL